MVQLAPRLGLVDDNLECHAARLSEAAGRGADLVVFPELGLTGYLLQDLAADVAMRSDDQRLFISAALLEGGEIRHVHRKVFLPNYGLFDERRFFAAGSSLRAAASEKLGLRLGICVCEDFWHLA